MLHKVSMLPSPKATGGLAEEWSPLDYEVKREAPSNGSNSDGSSRSDSECLCSLNSEDDLHESDGTSARAIRGGRARGGCGRGRQSAPQARKAAPQVYMGKSHPHGGSSGGPAAASTTGQLRNSPSGHPTSSMPTSRPTFSRLTCRRYWPRSPRTARFTRRSAP